MYDFTRQSSSIGLILVLHTQQPHHFAFASRADIIHPIFEE